MIKRKDAISRTNKTLRLMRCLEEIIESFSSSNKSPFPKPACFQRSKVYYKLNNPNTNSTNSMSHNNVSTLNQESNVYLFDSPIDNQDTYYNILNNFEYLNSSHVIDRNTIEYFVTNSCVRINNLGKWILITKIKMKIDDDGDTKSKSVPLLPPLWLLKYRYGREEENQQQVKLFEMTDSERPSCNREWILYIEACYNLLANQEEILERFKPNIELMKSISEVPKNWSFDYDEDLCDLLKDVVNTDVPGSIRNLIKSISVSTQRTSEDTDHLISLDKKTYWESDSYASTYNGYNAIRLYMKPFKRIKRLYIVISKKVRQHMPKDIAVFGGDSSDDIEELNKLTIKAQDDGDVLLLENCQKCYNYIEIRVKTCQRNGTNCRIYGIKMFTNVEDDDLIPSEIFLSHKLQRNFPRLVSFSPTFLYRRSELILRFIRLFDICMEAMFPIWTYGEFFHNMIKPVKKLLTLSSKRLNLLEHILNSIPTTPCYLPLIYIDRPLALACRGKFNLDPNYQNTIFMQIFNSLSRSLTFRYEKTVDQWWECKFLGEGIIDQGGGFRDSLSDISEELCPNTGAELPVPLPFFIRSPNQLQHDLNTFQDTFVPNPSCNLFEEYEFIGKLMGGCLRSKETLALYLAPFFWKKISCENISWKNDFATVDSAQVKLLDTIEKLNKTEYELIYANEITWSCTLSDGTMHKLKPNENLENVSYEDRLEYCDQVRNVRLSEFDKQIDAIKRGLQSVLSKHVFTLLTWSEFELKICGAPKITVEDLKMSIEYEDELNLQDNRVKYFWEAISNFTNEERSKFVRFVTGRKRLPVKIYFCTSDQPPTSFPDSSTCNCSIYFPNYPNAEVAEEKLRYAIHNCVAIDTDCSNYEDI